MTRRSLSLALALGLLGGLVLALSHAFFTPGKYILLPWAAAEPVNENETRGGRI